MLSGVVLTHNSEGSLERTLNSLSFCDELVVIDDESTDKTALVAKQCGASVFVHPLNGNFASQRNFGISCAKGDWVLFVDSDEIVPHSLAEEIQSAVSDSDSNGFFMHRQDYLYGRQLKYGETANVTLLRLARKRAGKWIRSVHEVWDISGNTRLLKTPLQHYPHQTLHEFIKEINRYSTLHAQEFYKAGKQTNWFEILAYPKGKFLQNYVLRQGFRDGMPGLVVAIMMSFHSFLARGKLYLLWKRGLRYD